VFQVEVIGDAYITASGVPLRNGDLHATEIVTMALHILSAISEFEITNMPTQRVLIRIGIHSGKLLTHTLVLVWIACHSVKNTIGLLLAWLW
jgi:hypothetical protein